MAPTREELDAAFCWEADDNVPRRPATTAFRREARYHQAQWREAHHLPIGTQPIRPLPKGPPARKVGSRLPLDYGESTGANFLTPVALEAARTRTSYVEAHQTFDHQRLWADLLSSMALAFNVFGDLAADLGRADRAVHRWFPDAPGRVVDVRFAHSPGRLDPDYLNNWRSFATAFILESDDGGRGIVAADVQYHELNKSEVPRPQNLERYTEVAKRSGVFAPGAIDRLRQRSDLCVVWLEHLLMFSMLQHVSAEWTWGRYLVVYPSANSDLADSRDRYRATLADDTTYSTMTLESLLGSSDLPKSTVTLLRDRYLFS
jgi:PD-(D/E)XK nuclease superfamily protein